MKHLMLFEGFRDDIKKQLADAKKSYKKTKKDLKKSYKDELESCTHDIEDNYNIYRRHEDNDEGLITYRYEFWCKLERMDELFEDILSTANKIFNHLNSDIELDLNYSWMNYNQTYPDEFNGIDNYIGDSMEDLEKFLKNARRKFKIELQKTVNQYDGKLKLWDEVSDKPLPSPRFEDMRDLTDHHTLESDEFSHPFMIFVDFAMG